MNHVSRRITAMGLAPLCLVAASAHADNLDTLQLQASYTLTRDDNLFRLPKGINNVAAIGRDSPAETIKAATAALIFSKDYGLQHIDLRATAVNYDYENFSYLGFTALNFTGGLRWSFTPRVRGTVNADRQETLNSFGDFQNYRVRNRRIVTSSAIEGIYELDGAWQLVGAASSLRVQNSAPVIEQRAFSSQSVDGGVMRVFGSGTEASYRLRRGTGDYSAVSFASVGFLPAGFDDTEHLLRLKWNLSPKTQLDARASYLRRHYADFGFRSYSGLTATTTLDWAVTAQVRLNAAASRELGDFQSLYSNYFTTDRLSVAPTWQIRPKVALSFRQDISRRSFEGSVPNVVVPTRREDKLYLSRLSVEWHPRDQVTVSAWVQRDKRDSNFSNFGFLSRSVGVLAQVSF